MMTVKKESKVLRYERYRKYYLNVKRVLGRPEVQKSLDLVLSVFLIVMLVGFALRPSFKKIAEIKKDIKSLRNVSKQLESKKKALEQANLRWAELERSAIKVGEIIPVGANELDFLEGIEALVKEAGVEYISGGLEDTVAIKQGEEKVLGSEELEITSGDFTIKVVGSYDALWKFLSALEQGKRLVKLEGITFTKEHGLKNRVELNIKGKVYYLTNKDLKQKEKIRSVK